MKTGFRFIGGWLLGAALVLFGAGSANATCWNCQYDWGIGGYVCFSLAGDGYTSCTPNWETACIFGSPAHCDEDECGCFRFPALDQDTSPSVLVNVLLFQERPFRATSLSPLTKLTLKSSAEIPSADELRDALAHAYGVRDANALGICASASFIRPVRLTGRLIDESGAGLLVETAPSGDQLTLKVSELQNGFEARSLAETQAGQGTAFLVPCQVESKSFVALVWVGVSASYTDATVARGREAFAASAQRLASDERARVKADLPPAASILHVPTGLQLLAGSAARAGYR